MTILKRVRACRRSIGAGRGVVRVGVTCFALATTVGACQDLAVLNLTDPDRDRALADQEDLEALVGGSFAILFASMHNSAREVNLLPAYASEMVGVFVQNGQWSETSEPRTHLENFPGLPAGEAWGTREVWPKMLRVASNFHDAFRTIEELDSELPASVLAFGKLMQGWAWGYMAALFDQVPIVPETVPFSSDAEGQVIESLVPWDVALEHALASLDQAIAIAQANSFSIPSFSTSRLWFATPQPMTQAEFRRLASTLAARLLVLSARTPADRANVDWNRVLQYTAEGLTSDFETVLEPGFRSSLLYAASQASQLGCGSCMRLDYRLIGPADVSGAYQAWVASSLDNRNRFDIETPDRRVTGVVPQSDGAYTQYWDHDNGFPSSRGVYHRSAYQWGRRIHAGLGSNEGTAVMVRAEENNLLRAEALLRTGDRSGAATLVNQTRTRSHTLPDGVTYPGLPAVTADGVPPSADCVPRTDAGECGDLLTALRYERMLELIATDALRSYLDSRGFGTLPDHSWVQAPIPGNELDLLGLPIYTFGGPGGEASAVYAPATLP